MIKKLMVCLLMCSFALGIAQSPKIVPKVENKIVRKIKIKHADPWLVALILAGKIKWETPPEISTLSH